MENNGEAVVTINPDSLTEMTDDELLAFTQKRRRVIVSQVMGSGTPSSSEDRMLLMQALDGIDRAALGNKRIRSNDRASDENAKISRGITEMLASIGNSNPFQNTTGNGPITLDRISNTEALPVARVLEGEFKVGTEELSFDQFIEENGFGKIEERVDDSGKIVSSLLSASETTHIIIEDEDSYFDPNAE